MPLCVSFGGYQWQIRPGGPPMGSRERTEPSFVEALQVAHPPLSSLTEHEIASWIVARLDFITDGSLVSGRSEFRDDTDEFGYQIRLSDASKTTLAHGAVVFQAKRIYFASVNLKIDDFQSIVVGMLADSPRDLSVCEVAVFIPESKRKRLYGWNGYSLLNT